MKTLAADLLPADLRGKKRNKLYEELEERLVEMHAVPDSDSDSEDEPLVDADALAVKRQRHDQICEALDARRAARLATPYKVQYQVTCTNCVSHIRTWSAIMNGTYLLLATRFKLGCCPTNPDVCTRRKFTVHVTCTECHADLATNASYYLRGSVFRPVLSDLPLCDTCGK